MSQPLSSARKRDSHEKLIREVVDFAHEIRIHLLDAQVIYGSVTPFATGDAGSFRIRPWGRTAPMVIQFGDVALAAPVKQMGWTRHRAIAAAQQAGIFGEARTPALETPALETPALEGPAPEAPALEATDGGAVGGSTT